MILTSTRNPEIKVPFSKGIINSIPQDGGLYVPSNLQDLRRWIMYTDENTSFQNIAGTLTSAFINEEFSPIICEKIATEAFPHEPVLKQLDDNLFTLELYHGFTGCHRDYGVSYLCSLLETMLTMNGGNAVFLDYTRGELGSILAKTLKGKRNLKAVLLCKKGEYRGLKDEDLYWKGGNIYPLEVEGDNGKDLIREVFADTAFSEEYNLTVANTANFGRLMGHFFFFPYAFSRIKNKVHSDIYYALAPGNYSNLVAGLYSWRFALPLGGFVLPSTGALTTDTCGSTLLLDSIVSMEKRSKTDPSDPSNLERLEDIFSANSLMIRNFVYPSAVTNEEVDQAAKELFIKYGIFADRHTGRAYAALKNRSEDIFDDEGAAVLIARDDPALSQSYCRHTLGEAPEQSEKIKDALKPTILNRPCVTTAEEIKNVIREISKQK
ncbi:MAG: threonine synthase [Treponema sp.]|nr:threonine synthase [Treponema sp.]